MDQKAVAPGALKSDGATERGVDEFGAGQLVVGVAVDQDVRNVVQSVVNLIAVDRKVILDGQVLQVLLLVPLPRPLDLDPVATVPRRVEQGAANSAKAGDEADIPC